MPWKPPHDPASFPSRRANGKTGACVCLCVLITYALHIVACFPIFRYPYHSLASSQSSASLVSLLVSALGDPVLRSEARNRNTERPKRDSPRQSTPVRRDAIAKDINMHSNQNILPLLRGSSAGFVQLEIRSQKAFWRGESAAFASSGRGVHLSSFMLHYT